jgi:predicted MFS family arabinose efflux permease
VEGRTYAVRLAVTASSSSLRRLWARPPFRRWAVANLVARLPLTMNLLAMVLVGEAVTGSLGAGAALSGLSIGAAGFAAPLRGRRLDRVELRSGLRTDLLQSSAAVAAMAVAAAVGAPIPVLCALAVVQGVAYAAVLGGFRALLVPTVPPEDIEPANALDAVFVEVAFVAGPAVAGALALVVPPAAVLGLMATGFALAALLLRGLPTRPPLADVRASGPDPLRTPGATPVYLLTLAVGAALGGFEAAVPARLVELGADAAAAGPMLALTAAGSGVAGVVAAGVRDPLRRGRLVGGVLLLVFAATFLPVALARGVALLGVALLVLGAPIAPLNALGSMALQRSVAVGRQAEGFALFPAMVLIGAGAGQVTTGVVVDRVGASAVLLALAALPLAAGAVVLAAAARRRRRGLPAGVGHLHDPAVRDPAAWSPAAEQELRPPAAN